MGYVESNRLPSETVVYQTRLHWMVLVRPLFLFVVILLVFAVMAVLATEPALPTVLSVVTFMSLLLSVNRSILGASSEFAVTDRRVLIKLGLIRRHSLELMLDKVEGIGVDQGLLGRLFDYGTITVSGTGGTREVFPSIAHPLVLRREVQQQVSTR